MTDETRNRTKSCLTPEFWDAVRLFMFLPGLVGFAVIMTILFFACVAWGDHVTAVYSLGMSAIGWGLLYLMLKRR